MKKFHCVMSCADLLKFVCGAIATGLRSFTRRTFLEPLHRLVRLLRRVVASPIAWVRDKLGEKLMMRMLTSRDNIGRDVIAAVSGSVFDKVYAQSCSLRDERHKGYAQS